MKNQILQDCLVYNHVLHTFCLHHIATCTYYLLYSMGSPQRKKIFEWHYHYGVVDCYIVSSRGLSSLGTQPLGSPLPQRAWASPWFGYCDTSKYDSSRSLINICTLGLSFGMFTFRSQLPCHKEAQSWLMNNEKKSRKRLWRTILDIPPPAELPAECNYSRDHSSTVWSRRMLSWANQATELQEIKDHWCFKPLGLDVTVT